MAETLIPFPGFTILDGYHCQSSSVAGIYHFNGYPLSEELLFGLGAGMGFMYWHQKGVPPFIGGRGNTKTFFTDIGERTGVTIEEKSTSSEKVAEKALLSKLDKQEPVMVFADMGFLPWFELPEEYHFGGHTFVVCGYDGDSTVLGCDIDPKSSGLKKGMTAPVSLEQLRKARGSKYKPFPPKNTYLTFDFSRYREPGKEDIYRAIFQEAESMLYPPISNFGIKGIRRAGKEIRRWPELFSEHDLRMNLFSTYIFIEIGGTGGGSFRYMYSRFLHEAAERTDEIRFHEAADRIRASGKKLTRLGLTFKKAETHRDPASLTATAPDLFNEIADMEEEAFRDLCNLTRLTD